MESEVKGEGGGNAASDHPISACAAMGRGGREAKSEEMDSN
jgi:hypothetical protein